MSRNPKVVTKKIKKQAKKTYSDIEIIDALNKRNIHGILNENNVEHIFNLAKSALHSFNGRLFIEAVCDNRKCAEKLFDLIRNEEDGTVYCVHGLSPMITVNNFGENAIFTNAYIDVMIEKYLTVSSLANLIMSLRYSGISNIGILNYMKSRHKDAISALAENAEYPRSIGCVMHDGCKSCNESNSSYAVDDNVAIILRMFNANPK